MNLSSLPHKYWLALLVLFVLTAIIFMPMRWAVGAMMPDMGAFSAGGAAGTIWSGRLDDARLGKLSLGTVNAGLDPLGLFGGKIGFWFEQPAASGSPTLRGDFAQGFGSIAANDITGTVPVANLVSGLSLAQLNFDNVSVSFSNGKCRTASGSVRLVPSGQIFSGLGLDAGLLGRARCDAGDLLLPFASESTMETVDLRISADGGYRATLRLMEPTAEMAPILSLAGFRPIAGGFQKTGKGRFW